MTLQPKNKSVKVVHVSQLDQESLGFTKPECIDGHRVSFAYSDDGNARCPVYVQFPMSIVLVTDDRYGLSVDQETASVICKLESDLVTYLHERSPDYFDGKQFSEARFRSSLEGAIDDGGLLRFDIDTNAVIKDKFDGEADKSELTSGARTNVILSLSVVEFVGKRLIPRWKLVQAKVYNEDQLVDWYLKDAVIIEEEDVRPPTPLPVEKTLEDKTPDEETTLEEKTLENSTPDEEKTPDESLSEKASEQVQSEAVTESQATETNDDDDKNFFDRGNGRRRRRPVSRSR